jgi:hypothetical protein
MRAINALRRLNVYSAVSVMGPTDSRRGPSLLSMPIGFETESCEGHGLEPSR